MAEKSVKTRVQMKRGSQADWDAATAAGFKPLEGEYIFYTDLNKVKIGKKDASGNLISLSELSFLDARDADTLDGKHASDFVLKTEAAPADAEKNVQSDWNVSDTTSDAFIKNKPNVVLEGDSRLTDARTPKAHNQAATTITEDATHRFVTDTEKAAWNAKSNFSGNYNDLTNKPTIPTKSSLGLDKVTNDAQVKRSEMGVANGVATLGSDGKVPTAQLPSYVDDVLTYTAFANFPATGEDGKIYVDKTTNKTYRWSGSAYIEISASLALGTTASTAYYGDKGKIAYDHSQIAHAPSNAQKNSDITKAEIEAKLTGTITSHTHSYESLISSGTADPSASTASQYYFKYN